MSSPAIADRPTMREHFILPTNRSVNADIVEADLLDAPCTYLCGNSLGVLPRHSKTLIEEELSVWGTRAVEGHFSHPFGRPWKDITDTVNPLIAELVGAKRDEVACMGTLTNNLHLMMNSFYKPTSSRYKILCEAKAFPSDQYAFASQAEMHGLSPSTAVLELMPREGEYALREEDILATISREGESIALVLFSGVQYYTGQWFPMESITRAAKNKGCICGWDLAHAIGNVPMQLHGWGVDFAVWCSYKYLNAGPGAIAGLFFHEKWAKSQKPLNAGWWGHDPTTRFSMPSQFSPIQGAQGFQQSNPNVFSVVSLLGSLQVFKEAGMMPTLRKRSVHLTAYLERLLMESKWFVHQQEVLGKYGREAALLYEGESNETKLSHKKDEVTHDEPAFTIITPLDPDARGAQLSLMILPPGRGMMQHVYSSLHRFGVISDDRQPNVIRLAPTPLYNTEGDCRAARGALDAAFEELSAR